MSDTEESGRTSEAEAELERQIRAERKFSLEEAIMRMAGPGMMKGESPVTKLKQAEAAIDGYLRQHLTDSAGRLPLVLHRKVQHSELLLKHVDLPLVALANYVRQVLDSDYLLEDLVREVDSEWGRLLGERPFFNKAGVSPHPDDPYTIESVRRSLNLLITDLAGRDL